MSGCAENAVSDRNDNFAAEKVSVQTYQRLAQVEDNFIEVTSEIAASQFSAFDALDQYQNRTACKSISKQKCIQQANTTGCFIEHVLLSFFF